MSILNLDDAGCRTSRMACRKTLLRSLSNWLSAALRRRRARRELAQLDDHLLRDIGLTRYDVGAPRRKMDFEGR